MTGRGRDCIVAAQTCVCDAVIDVNQNSGNRVLETTLRTISAQLKGILDDDWAEMKRVKEAASEGSQDAG